MSDDREMRAQEQKPTAEGTTPDEIQAKVDGNDPAEQQQEKPVAESASPQGEPAEVQRGERRPEDPKDADDVLTKKMPESDAGEATASADAEVLAMSRKRTRRSFLLGGVAAAGAYGFYHWLDYGPHRDMLPSLVDRTYDVNAAISRGVLRDHALAPTYPRSRAEAMRINGVVGLGKELEMERYRLQVVGVRDAEKHPRYVKDVTAWEYGYKNGKSDEDQGHDTKTDPSKSTANKMAPAPALQQAQEDENHTGRKPRGMGESGESDSTLDPGTPGLLLTLDDFLPKLPRHEMVTQFKCIEGWSQISQWAGVRFADFLEMFPPESIDGREPRYLYMETPDGDYYVGYDLHALRHPQALLVTEMMGQPITQNHGAPLRLHTPTRYGYKQIKRIALIAYTNDKPDDYWTKLGYDWYAGL